MSAVGKGPGELNVPSGVDFDGAKTITGRRAALRRRARNVDGVGPGVSGSWITRFIEDLPVGNDLRGPTTVRNRAGDLITTGQVELETDVQRMQRTAVHPAVGDAVCIEGGRERISLST